jgi:hypothetical protein
MGNIAEVIEAVRAERVRAITELARLDEALHALEKLGANKSKRGQTRGARPRRKMSAAARRKIAAAQRARWAKVKKQSSAS